MCTVDEILSPIDVPSVILKDECIYCFESIYNDKDSETHSLNICLSCFQPLCHEHVRTHMNVTGNACENIHVNYLNLFKVAKEEEDDRNQDRDRNKKIKLQVIEKSEDETYNTFWKLLVFNVEDNEKNVLLESKGCTTIPPKINEILQSKSKTLVDQTNSWELELKTCQHIMSFDVNSLHSKEVDISSCNDCTLDSNLWLCLHCGNIGCGRQQIGIEGNSHALAHFDSNKTHPLAIKLGSLSKSSNDVYCYECDDEVKFSDDKTMESILTKFSFDLHNKLATEKTLTELQVEQNLNWDFKMTDSAGHELIKLEPNGNFGCGLINLGNSCYLNSILQALFAQDVSQWADVLMDTIGKDFPVDVVYPSNNVKCQLIKLLNAMKINPSRYPEGIKPRSFKNCIGQNNKEFTSNKQQDALEFLSYFVNELDKKLFKKELTNPGDLMRCYMEDRLQCLRCKHVKYSYQANESIQLPLKDNNEPQDIRERLDAFFKGEVIEFNCPHCQKMTEASKRPGLKTFPNLLVLSPIRIKLENWIPIKTANELLLPGVDDFDDVLDLSMYQSKGLDTTVETEFPEEQFKPDEAATSQLLETGFSQNAILRALYATGNNSNPEVAMNWLLQHMDESDLNAEFKIPEKSGQKPQINEESLNSMISMGLAQNLSRKALILNNGDINASIEWVFNNMDDNGELPEENTASQGAKEFGHLSAAPYKLTGVVCHKGTSVHSGHYVAFIKKIVDNVERWVLYNDEKIVLGDDTAEIKKNGYIYFYSRVE
ncbi:hypothetical protein KAFR_0C00410 [Kazachstania africana CBS 2517]|uniref:Ubiquitin carboxyl-terminal hydrolase n=1 Tax=Kazachstania africana (strain ATCC 22294 / BCRC 22015 / CBS 2517 / CECT 1963 / NBRC 1671 / NRRL Y-8276) TaxID=1071382 RepID=H2ARN6_KAZAF|nr:hypothetical protein KAFR_0C00410 [Kazachstania africana CBS 2517]CCF57036.1 hypothetical protein KAFR_0C00410 [Kazachstania africana CBS 2517]